MYMLILGNRFVHQCTRGSLLVVSLGLYVFPYIDELTTGGEMRFGVGRHQADIGLHEMAVQIKVSSIKQSPRGIPLTYKNRSHKAYILFNPVYACEYGSHQIIDCPFIPKKLPRTSHASRMSSYPWVPRGLVSLDCPECNFHVHPGRQVLGSHRTRPLLQLYCALVLQCSCEYHHGSDPYHSSNTRDCFYASTTKTESGHLVDPGRGFIV
jgi:hypothetical protein